MSFISVYILNVCEVLGIVRYSDITLSDDYSFYLIQTKRIIIIIIIINHSMDSLQKTAILGTSHIIRKVLQCEAWSVSGGDHRWFKGSTRKKCLWQETYIFYNNNNNNYAYEDLCWNRSEAEYLRSALGCSTLVVCLLGRVEGQQLVTFCPLVVVLRHELIVLLPVMCPSPIHQMIL